MDRKLAVMRQEMGILLAGRRMRSIAYPPGMDREQNGFVQASTRTEKATVSRLLTNHDKRERTLKASLPHAKPELVDLKETLGTQGQGKLSERRKIAVKASRFMAGGVPEEDIECIDRRFGLELSTDATKTNKDIRSSVYSSRWYVKDAMKIAVDTTGGEEAWKNSTAAERAVVVRRMFNQAPLLICSCVWAHEKDAVAFELIWHLTSELAEFWQHFCRERVVCLAELAWNEFCWGIEGDWRGVPNVWPMDHHKFPTVLDVPIKSRAVMKALGVSPNARLAGRKKEDTRDKEDPSYQAPGMEDDVSEGRSGSE
ncbi:unnamed protein product [Zymoseptoria tritici ST99CH_1E4]|uniref:Uncharacterized protein n=1 Tax=Zymoseptoria tritici ST99CH_1E4 TaxID=1276532 RepID=A0A2H1GZ75_ZYMTR|nr:unnamed protein product [Zymoseptoria tritici ST99CH_1E4]